MDEGPVYFQTTAGMLAFGAVGLRQAGQRKSRFLSLRLRSDDGSRCCL
jgi:hypothetical protein